MKLNPNYKKDRLKKLNSNGTSTKMSTTPASSGSQVAKRSSTPISPQQAAFEQSMIEANEKLRKIEDERIAVEILFKKMEEKTLEHEMQTQQSISRLEELRERSVGDSRSFDLLTEAQNSLAEAKKGLMREREERKEMLNEKRTSWTKQEEEIYRQMRKESEHG